MLRIITKLAGVTIAFSVLYIGSSTAKTMDLLDNVYLKAGAGVAQFNKFKETEDGYRKKSLKASPVYNIGIGYRFSDAIRADLNFQYAEAKYRNKTEGVLRNQSQNIKTTAAFVNGYYDINFHESVVPYLTAGVGVGANKSSNLKQRTCPKRKGKDELNFIWNVGVGAQYNINKNFAFDLGYRYMHLGVEKTNDSESEHFKGGKQKIRGHKIIGSLVYNF